MGGCQNYGAQKNRDPKRDHNFDNRPSVFYFDPWPLKALELGGLGSG